MIATQVKERPIVFSAPMVRAILDGTKTVTRRIVKPQPVEDEGKPSHIAWSWNEGGKDWFSCCSINQVMSAQGLLARSPYHVGSNLWVREKHAMVEPACMFLSNPRVTTTPGQMNGHHVNCVYATESNLLGWDDRWRPSIHMPRWASRIDLRITNVTVERLQDITEDQCIAEGILRTNFTGYGDEPGLPHFPEPDVFYDYIRKSWTEYPRDSFRSLWVSINGDQSWDDNPFVWAVEFEVVT